MSADTEHAAAVLKIAKIEYASKAIATLSVGIQLQRLPYLVVGFVIFLLSTTSTSLKHHVEFGTLFFSRREDDYLEWLGPSNSAHIVLRAAIWLFYGYVVLGNGLLLHRLYLAWSGILWARMLGTVAYLGTIASTLAYLIYVARPTADRNAYFIVVNSLVTAAYNIFITSFIGLRLIGTRKKLLKGEGASAGWCEVVAHVLVESAFPIAFFGSIAAIMSTNILFNGGSARMYVIFRVFDVLYEVSAMIVFQVVMGEMNA
ncbi:hypothetical protein CC2G_002748 [Coprinopsis cinerea AmutBmut pab1-1]|nr:hypothetical protein CC2G_002748 [Coprinopsis cinerea AmutBmut pab1-1]